MERIFPTDLQVSASSQILAFLVPTGGRRPTFCNGMPGLVTADKGDACRMRTRGRLTARPTVPLCPTILHHHLIANKTPRFALMSHSQPTAASSSNFQVIINNALDMYNKRTKNDLLAHPLAPQLQACESPGAILAVLQQQVQGLDQSRTDDRWTKWLDPTVNVLFAFSATLGAGVGLVCLRTCDYLRSALSHLFGRYSHPRV